MTAWQRACVRYQGWIIPLALFAVALLPRVFALSHFITVDEPAWINRSARFLHALLTNDLLDTLDPHVLDGGGPGIVTMWAGSIGLLVRYVLGGIPAGDGLLPFVQFYMRPIDSPAILPYARMVTVLLSASLVPALYLGFKDWLGERVALLGALVLAFDPFYAAHSRVLHHDALVTIFVAFSLMWMLSGLWHRYSHWKMVLSGMTFTLAVLSKLMGGILGPFFIALLVLAYFQSPVFREMARLDAIRRLAVAAAIWGASAIVVFALLTPGLWVDPGLLFEALFWRGAIMAEKAHAQFFMGAATDDPGAFFYLVVFLFRTTPVTILGFVLSLWALRRQTPTARQLVFAVLAFVVLFTLFITVPLKKQDRYLLPILPWIDLLAAIGWLAALEYLVRFRQRAIETVRARYVLPVVLVLLQCGLLLGDYPYYFSAYNPLFGGTPMAAKALLVGWGEGLDEIGRYLGQKPDAETLVVSAIPAISLRPYFPGEVMDFYDARSYLWADYVVTYVSQFQRNFPSAELLQQFRGLEVEHVYSRHGLPYAYIYKGIRFAPYDKPTAANPTELDFGRLFRLAGFEDITTPDATGTLQLRLYWESLARTETDYTWSVRLEDRAGHRWAQTDVRPMGGVLPTNLWRPGAVVISDDAVLQLPPGMPPGDYDLYLQVYALADMSVLAVSDPSGRSSPTVAYLGTVPVRGWTGPNAEASLSVQYPVGQQLAAGIELIGFDLPESETSPGKHLPATLHWKAHGDVPGKLIVRFELLDESGTVIQTIAEEPPSGIYPTGAWKAGEIVQGRYELAIPGNIANGTYNVRLALLRPGALPTRQPLVDLGRIAVAGRSHSFAIPDDIPFRQTAEFGQSIALLGFGLEPGSAKPGDTALLTLYWQALAEPGTCYQAFVHVLDPDLTIRAQHDSIPGQGTLPTDTWLPGEVISDVHPIALATDVPEGAYQIEVGLYDSGDGQRLTVSSQETADKQDHIVLERPIHVRQ